MTGNRAADELLRTPAGAEVSLQRAGRTKAPPFPGHQGRPGTENRRTAGPAHGAGELFLELGAAALPSRVMKTRRFSK